MKTPHASNTKRELLLRDSTSSASRLGGLTPARSILALLIDQSAEEKGSLQPLSLPLPLLQKNLQTLSMVRLDSPVYMLSWLLYRLESQMDSILDLLAVPSCPGGSLQIRFLLGAHDGGDVLAITVSREQCISKSYLDLIERDFLRLNEIPAIWGFEIREVISNATQFDFSKEGKCQK